MEKKVDVILLSGGKGSRLRSIINSDISKALFKVNGAELITYSLESLDFSLVNNLIFAIDTGGVKEWVEAQDFPVNVIFSQQDKPGIYGAVKKALTYVETESFLVCNTDEVREGLSLKSLLEEHEASRYTMATMALAPVDHLTRHRIIETDTDGIITSAVLRNDLYKGKPMIVKPVNIGYVLYRKEVEQYFTDDGLDLNWNPIVDPLVERGMMKGVFYPDVSYFNVGTPEELKEAIEYFKDKEA
ncbi:MAG TPA: NDP-sugar synthase [Candidatus Saccharimonadales bacterium]|nr:NDP-sugar synthase [Candidatus Saccharimonadales bacterium]